MPSITTRSKIVRGARGRAPRIGRTTSRVVGLVEVPLVRQEPVQAPEARGEPHARAGLRTYRAHRRARCRPGTSGPPTASASASMPVDGSRSAKRESAKVGSRKFSITWVTRGICTTPPTIARTARMRHRRPSSPAPARRCGAPARGSRRRCPRGSPVDRVERLGMGEVALLELARLRRSARRRRRGTPSGRRRTRSSGPRPGADDVEDPVAAAALGCEREDVVLREVAGHAGEGAEGERRDRRRPRR